MFTSLLALIFTCLLLTSLTTQHCPSRKLLTFNAGLNPTVKQYENRKPLVEKALKSRTDVDVMCLQEIWYEEDLRSLLETLDDFPYTYSFIHHDVGELKEEMSFFARILNPWKTAPCISGSVFPFISCSVRYCRGLGTAALLGCLIQKCTKQIDALPQDCITCMLMSSGSAMTTLKTCANPLRYHNRMNGQGLVLLSRYPIRNVERKLFYPGVKQLLPRGYISADVYGLGKVACTHLTANIHMPYIEWNKDQLEATSWEQQQLNEINIINDDLKDEDHILIGDLNTGPAIDFPDREPIVGEFPANFETLLNYNYKSLYKNQDGRCTWCKDNLLLKEGNQNKILDHIMLKGFIGRNATRTLGLFDGEQLSDHYGETLNVCLNI